jgi:hypothetical protein
MQSYPHRAFRRRLRTMNAGEADLTSGARVRAVVLVATSLAAGAAAFSLAPIPQPEAYHAFADARP